MSTVLNVAGHPIDLDDGRTLAPGEQAEDVNTDHPHNRVLVVEGLATVTEGTTPKKTQPERLIALASKEVQDEEPTPAPESGPKTQPTTAADNKEGKVNP